MCLTKVTERDVRLKEDLEVWKIIKIVDGEEYSQSAETSLNKYKLKARNVPLNIFLIRIKGYKPGFHGYLTKPPSPNFFYSVRNFIIPKNSKVTYGQNFRGVVVVSQTLINPRMKPEK